ncbi:hypothetical protein AAFF_G00218090 [Aldrovandia affinis]|uniref:Uncharacterized protein n=1 Tax=Aldrovandia affinis TaxID=143900 RepID=A0AAD7SW16_9TELE|nr:hypothetical protein AAFF_G00218090 [Aldrovandia affinis]
MRCTKAALKPTVLTGLTFEAQLARGEVEQVIDSNATEVGKGSFAVPPQLVSFGRFPLPWDLDLPRLPSGRCTGDNLSPECRRLRERADRRHGGGAVRVSAHPVANLCADGDLSCSRVPDEAVGGRMGLMGGGGDDGGRLALRAVRGINAPLKQLSADSSPSPAGMCRHQQSIMGRLGRTLGSDWALRDADSDRMALPRSGGSE